MERSSPMTSAAKMMTETEKSHCRWVRREACVLIKAKHDPSFRPLDESASLPWSCLVPLQCTSCSTGRLYPV